MRSLTLKESILAKSPEADQSILDEFLVLANKHSLKWVSYSEKGAYFIMSKLSEVKGVDSKDYDFNWANLTTSKKEMSSESLAGWNTKLEGIKLSNFKGAYQSKYNEVVEETESLHIGDWLHAYSYLTQEVVKPEPKLLTGIEGMSTSEIIELASLAQKVEDNDLKWIT